MPLSMQWPITMTPLTLVNTKASQQAILCPATAVITRSNIVSLTAQAEQLVISSKQFGKICH
jgi:hypothetical protein